MRHTYLLLCSDNTLYTWITTDLDRRIFEHNESDLGAKYTKIRRPVQLIWSKEFETRSEASKEEWRIKKMKREEKQQLCSSLSLVPLEGIKEVPKAEDL